MGVINPKLCLLVVFTLSLLLIPSLSYETSGADNEALDEQTEDPRQVYERCRSGCGKHRGSTLQEQCIRTCQEQYDEMKKHGGRGDCGCGRQECSRSGDCRCGHPDCRCGGGEELNRKRPAEERLVECRRKCVKEVEGQKRERCETKCEHKFEKRKKEEGGGCVEEAR